MSVSAASTEIEQVPSAPSHRRSHSLRQNAIAVFTGQLVTWTLTAITLALLPRYLGPERMGQMGIGTSYQMLVVTFAGLGMGTLITRDVARDRIAAARLLGTAVWLSLALGTIGGVIAAVVAVLSGYSEATAIAVALSVAVAPFFMLEITAGAVLQGVEVMRFEAMWDAAAKVVLLFALVVVMFGDWGLVPILATMLATAVVVSIPALSIARRYLPFRVFSFSYESARYLIVNSLPFFMVGIFLVLYMAVDALQLSYLSGERAVGIYSAPARIFGTLLFVPNIVILVTFPRMAAAYHDHPGKLAELARPTLRLVVAATLPVTILAVGFADEALVAFIGAGFTESGPVIAVLALSLVPTSILIVTHRILIAADRQNVWTAVMLVALAAKVGLNFIFIPAFDAWFDNPALGAATSLVVIESLMMLSTFWLMPQGVVDRTAMAFYLKLGLATGAAAVVMVITLPLGLFAAGVTACGAYLATTLLTRAHTVDELRDGISWAAGRVQNRDADGESAA